MSEVQIIYTMARGKQKKQKQIRNISGLRNQAKASPAPSAFSEHPTPPRSRAPSPEDDGDESDIEIDDEDLDLLIHFDSCKTNFQNEEEHDEWDEMMSKRSTFRIGRDLTHRRCPMQWER